MLLVRLAHDRGLLDAGAFGRAVTSLGAFWGRAVHLYELSIVDIAAERAFDGLKISLVILRLIEEPRNLLTLRANRIRLGCDSYEP